MMANWDKIVTDLILQEDGSWKEPPKPPPINSSNTLNFDMYFDLIDKSDELMSFLTNYAKFL